MRVVDAPGAAVSARPSSESGKTKCRTKLGKTTHVPGVGSSRRYLARSGVVNARYVASDDPSTSSASPAFPDGYDFDRYIVRVKNERGKGTALNAASALHYDLDSQNAVAVTIPAQALQGLMNNPNIEYIEEDKPRYSLHKPSPRNNIRGGDIDHTVLPPHPYQTSRSRLFLPHIVVGCIQT